MLVIIFAHLKITNPSRTAVTSFTKEFNPWLAKRPLKTNGCLANRQLNSLVKDATDVIEQGWKYLE